MAYLISNIPQFKCWVRKEAIVKAWGMGIDDSLNKIQAMDYAASGSDKIVYANHGRLRKAWCVEDLELDADYIAALSVEGEVVSKKDAN